MPKKVTKSSSPKRISKSVSHKKQPKNKPISTLVYVLGGIILALIIVGTLMNGCSDNEAKNRIQQQASE